MYNNRGQWYWSTFGKDAENFIQNGVWKTRIIPLLGQKCFRGGEWKVIKPEHGKQIDKEGSS